MSAPSDNLFVADLPEGTTEENIWKVFGSYGTIQQCKVLEKGTSALVRFQNIDEAKWIVEHVNGNIPQGLNTPVQVRYANPPGSKWKGDGKGGGYDMYGMGFGGKGGFGMPGFGMMPYGMMGGKGFGGKGGFPMGGGFDAKGFGKGMMPGLYPKDAKTLVQHLAKSGTLPGGMKWENDDKTLFVGGLPENTTDLEMYQMFAPFGAIAPRGASARIDKEKGICTGIGFVNYLHSESAQAAINTLNRTQLSDGSFLSVKVKGPPKSAQQAPRAPPEHFKRAEPEAA